MKIEHPSLEGLTNILWRPVAACGSLCRPYGLPYIYTYIERERFLRFWRPPVLLDDECKIDGSEAGAWRLLDDEWKTDWKKFSHARA